MLNKEKINYSIIDRSPNHKTNILLTNFIKYDNINTLMQTPYTKPHLLRRTSMIRIVICDDNPIFASTLSDNITSLCAKTVPEELDCRVGPVFTSAESVLSYIEVNKINIIFLDIDMPKVSGFDLAETISQKYPETLIIFVSAYDNFVYSSFAYSPFRFLRKSHLKDELPLALSKAIEKCVCKSMVMSFHSIDGMISIRSEDIIYFECDRNYYTVFCSSGVKYKCRGTISSLEAKCDDNLFIRIHSAYIVSLEHIDKIMDNNFVILSNGQTLTISRRRQKEFKDAYMLFVRRRYSK